jgi:hypothetical protein
MCEKTLGTYIWSDSGLEQRPKHENVSHSQSSRNSSVVHRHPQCCADLGQALTSPHMEQRGRLVI